MTTTTEKLQRIRAKCVELLALAEQRTPGKWTWGMRYIACPSRSMEVAMIPHGRQCTAYDEWPTNADFIASCAGAAEAGWRSTIAAIDALLQYRSFATADNMSMRLVAKPAEEAIATIIAAWPEDLL